MCKNSPVFLFASLLLSQLTGFGEWKKHVIVQGKGSMNVAVASDFDKDGHVDAMTSFGGGATVFRGPDWKTSRQVVQFKEAYKGKRRIGGGCIHGCLLDVDGDGDQDFVGSNQMVFWLECPDKPFDQDWTFRVIDDEIPRYPLPDNRGRRPGWQARPDRQLGKTGGHPLPQFHCLAPSAQKPKIRGSLDTPCLCRQGCTRWFPLHGPRRCQWR